MIIPFSIKVSPSNNKAKIVFTLCFFGSFAFFFLSSILPLYKGVVGLLGLVLLTVAILMYTKYMSSVFYYEITTDSEGQGLFLVRQVIGKRETLLCRIALSEIVKAEREDKKTSNSHKTPYDHKKYSYTPTLFPGISYRLTTQSRYEKAEVIIEAPEDFVNLLVKYSIEEREREALFEE